MNDPDMDAVGSPSAHDSEKPRPRASARVALHDGMAAYRGEAA